jgi:ADP-ribose pyrophosphatase YjhB (NUDIX family)/ribonuclease HI
VAARVLYTDGGSLGNGRVDQRARMAVYDAGLGQVVVDQELGALTNNEAEYRAIQAAIDYARRGGLRPVEIRSDSQLCVNQIKGAWKVKEARLQPLVAAARASLAQVGGTISWVPREQNPAGHFIESGSPGQGAAAPAAPAAPGPSAAAVDAPSGPHCLRCGTRLVERPRDHRPRPTCPRCDWVLFNDPKVAAAAVLSIGDKILLCRRAIDPGLGKWSFPAGFVDRGEEVRSALEREVAEETGLPARLGRLVGVYSAPGNPVILIVYAAEAEGEPRASDEALEVALFDPDELPELAFEHDRQVVADWRATSTRSSAESPRRT